MPFCLSADPSALACLQQPVCFVGGDWATRQRVNEQPLLHSSFTQPGQFASRRAFSSLRSLMHVKTEYLISPENPRRNSDDNILLSLKLTMSHSHEDHFSYGCFGRQSRARTPNVAGNNAHNNGRRGLFSMGQGGRTVLPPLHLPFRASRSPGPFSSTWLSCMNMQLIIPSIYSARSSVFCKSTTFSANHNRLAFPVSTSPSLGSDRMAH